VSEAKPRFKRILLKLSGEALSGDRDFGIDQERVESLADEVVGVHEQGVELAIVVGGGNIIRGMDRAAAGMDRSTADYAGMLGSVLNALTVQDALERRDAQTRVLSAITVAEVAEPYIRRRAVRHLEKGRLVIFAGGTGNPYFSTDTAAVLRAIQIKANVIIKATSVEGVYSADPKRDPQAKFYDEISFRDVIVEELKVIDQTAITLCRENALPLIVLNIHRPGSVVAAIRGERVGTLVR
jgi:uridylate kinase